MTTPSMFIAALVVVLTAGACADGGAVRAAPADGACQDRAAGSSAGTRAPVPSWASVNAPGGLPVRMGVRGDALGYLFADPLRAGRPTDPANKILWYVRQPRDGHPLEITARPKGARAPVVRVSVPADSGPGEIYPSIVEVPSAGCWALDLSWGSNHDSLELTYL
ncbi:hypothetical protein ABZT47_05085 [Sphaerisporangium sp. NPDC005289]|uniref:hypothetical protein n=1 Tax=Sphaerisporangium sp. NPDC005289 TaxID=3155247 RepID=UPI0033AD7077